MVSKFREIDKAVAYLVGGFREEPGIDRIEVAWYPDGSTRKRTVVVELGRLSTMLEQLCWRFPGATVVLDMQAKTQPFAAIQCLCDSYIKEVCPEHCDQQENRPLAAILACTSDNPPTDAARKATLDAIHDHVHKDSVGGSKRRRPSHHGRRH